METEKTGLEIMQECQEAINNKELTALEIQNIIQNKYIKIR
jgi:hypothetical protein